MDASNSPLPSSAAPSRGGQSGSSDVRLDPAASAALAEAVRSARPDPKTESGAEPPKEAATRRFKGSLLAQAAAALLLVGAGWAASYAGTLGTRDAIRRMEAESAASRDSLARLTDELAALKGTIAAARDVEQTASIRASGQAKLAEKIDRLAVAVQDPGKKLAALEERLNRMEGQILASLNTLSAAKPAATPAATPASAPQENAPAVPPVKAEPVEGWVLREVYNGSALVEHRNRGLYEVMPGNTIPGAGRVEAIERRGARWVVVTDRGFIATR